MTDAKRIEFLEAAVTEYRGVSLPSCPPPPALLALDRYDAIAQARSDRATVKRVEAVLHEAIHDIVPTKRLAAALDGNDEMALRKGVLQQAMKDRQTVERIEAAMKEYDKKTYAQNVCITAVRKALKGPTL